MKKKYWTKFDFWVESKSNAQGWKGFLFSMTLISLLWVFFYFEYEITVWMQGKIIADKELSNPKRHETHMIVVTIMWFLVFVPTLIRAIRTRDK